MAKKIHALVIERSWQEHWSGVRSRVGECCSPWARAHQAASPFLLDDHGHPRATSPTPHCCAWQQSCRRRRWCCCLAIVAAYVRCHISGLRLNFENPSTLRYAHWRDRHGTCGADGWVRRMRPWSVTVTQKSGSHRPPPPRTRSRRGIAAGVAVRRS